MSQEQKDDVLVVIGGALNPVHTQHIQLLIEAKRLAEQQGWKVIGGALAPAPDGYVKAKIGEEQLIPSKHRIAMCNIAVKASGLSDWVQPCTRTHGSAIACGVFLRKELNCPDAKIAQVVGADRFKKKWLLSSKDDIITVCIGRKNCSSELTDIYSETVPSVISSHFIFESIELANVSSTEVRRILMPAILQIEPSLHNALERLVNESMIHQAVADYLKLLYGHSFGPQLPVVQVLKAVESYDKQSQRWPASGRHILAQWDHDSVVVYQAFNEKIAKYAVCHQLFGGPHYSTSRMTWIKPNFLWVMYRCGWAMKRDQTHVLALKLRRSAFEKLLSISWISSWTSVARNCFSSREEWIAAKDRNGSVLQWDPDHDIDGTPHPARRVLQLGISAHLIQHFFNTKECIMAIEDITAFVSQQRQNKDHGDIVETPTETIYEPLNPNLRCILGLDS